MKVMMFVRDVCLTLTQNFNKGKRDQFFKHWNKVIPLTERKTDIETKQVEFYIRVYFAIYHQHPYFEADRADNYKALAKDEMNHFKRYLENKGSEMSKSD